MSAFQPVTRNAIDELERMRDELRECIQKAQEALERTETLLLEARAANGTETGNPPLPPPE